MDRIDRMMCQEAVNMFGAEAQMVVAVEELSELQKEICKVLRGDGDADFLEEEIADVEIMIEQLKYILSCESEVKPGRAAVDENIASWKVFKIKRLQERIRAHDEEMAREGKG